jgi:hypothetical protein
VAPHSIFRIFCLNLLCGAAALASMTTSALAALPEGRAYEQVTPAVKGIDLITNGSISPAWPSEDGNRIFFPAPGALGETPSGSAGAYIATRGASGWRSEAVAAQEDRGNFDYAAQGVVATDLSAAALVAQPGGELSQYSGPVRLVRGTPGSPFTTITELPFFQDWLTPRGGSDDLDTVVYEHRVMGGTDPATVDPAAAGTISGHSLLFSWRDGVRRLVGVDDDGKLLSPCGTALAGHTVNPTYGSPNAVSTDGSRIFFSSPEPSPLVPNPACAAPSELYVRIDDERTVKLSEPEPGVSDPNGTLPATYAGASADGRTVFFTTSQRLVAEDETDPNATNIVRTPDLYSFDVDGGELRLLTGGPGGPNAGVTYVLVSDDGSTVYVVTRRPLVAGTGVDGQLNLYRYDTATGDRAFIATLHESDLSRLGSAMNFVGPFVTSGWYTTRSGADLLFTSLAGLTPDADGTTNEIYRYERSTGALVCVSCRPPGAEALPATCQGGPCVRGTPEADAEFVRFNGGVPGLVLRYNRPMSEDGSRVFFDTFDALVPEDVNGERDVYEWHDGKRSLITSGTDGDVAFFLGASRDGRDAFFLTQESLVPGDRDDLADIYDARIGGGFPAAETPAQCREDACQGQPAARPAAPAVSSDAGREEPSSRAARRLGLMRIPAAAARRFARSMVIALSVRSSAAGTVRATASSTIGRRRVTVATARRKVAHAGTATLRLRLNKRARQALTHRRTLPVRITVRLSGAPAAKTTTLTLRRTR